jgi:hypothetical protein
MQHQVFLEQYKPVCSNAPERTSCVNLQDLLWEDPDFKPMLELLEKDRDIAYLVRDLKAIFAALAALYAQLNSSEPDVQVWKQTEATFRKAVQSFVDNPMPSCAYRLKFYDHAWLEHVVNQTEALQKHQMSLALLSSKFLEANNKCVKAVLRQLPGGGTHKASMGLFESI